MKPTVGVMLLVGIVLLAGCAGLAGDDTGVADDADDTADDAAGEADDGDDRSDGAVEVEVEEADDDETDDDGFEYDPEVMSPLIDDPTAVNVSIYRHNETYPLPDGQLEVVDASGELVATHDVGDETPVTVDSLEPGQNYTLTVVEFTGEEQFPPTTKRVDPGQTDDAEFFAAFELPGADSYEFLWRSVEHEFLDGTEIIDEEALEERNRQVLQKGVYDEGDFMMKSGSYGQFVSERINTPKFGAVGGEYYLRDFNREWRAADDHYAFDPNHSPELLPVNEGLESLDSQTEDLQEREFDRFQDLEALWAYNETIELNDSRVPGALQFEPMPEENEGKTVHVYDVNIWGYSEVAEVNFSYHNTGNARVYVDAESGYVLRWTANERVSPGTGALDYARGMNPSVHVIDFYNHDSEEAELNPEAYEPFE